VEIVAWSLGAMRALELATRMELGGLVLVAATPQFARDSTWRHGWSPRVLVRMASLLEPDPAALLDDFESHMFVPGEGRPEIPRERDIPTLREGLRYLETFSLLDRLDEVRCPVRLLHGALDRVVPVGAAEHLAASLPHADLTVWEDAGHAPHLTRPERFRAWLDQT